MITDKLPPSVDQRMSTWLRIQEQLSRKQPAKLRPTVTHYEYGAEGYPLAKILKKLLEQKTGDPWTVFDKT